MKKKYMVNAVYSLVSSTQWIDAEMDFRNLECVEIIAEETDEDLG